jgi:putative ABC transport system permease protein
MLELRQIKKDYLTGDNTVHALKGIDIAFRDSEFVAVLGPSGCGKTTMLNIIGGLDGYTSGDLLIGGRSTKDFKDRDWDAYRNHSVGFVFQSYNLIPHQSVLSNVELALTLSGVPKSERRRRARKALEDVGLAEQLSKRPNELSGGQMQRVAIARALVNDPEIILADEPTGALDTETGLQVMDLLHEISRDRLVVMVTHNPDLAERYATRTVTMLDGLITGDSAPLSAEELSEAGAGSEQSGQPLNVTKKTGRKKKPSMSIWTSFGLSLNNLFTKKGRTILTSFAGSIGIIGIALIYAVSNGATVFINSVQEQTLTAYPISLQSESVDLGSLIETFMGKAESSGEHDLDAVYQKAMLYGLVNAMNSIESHENDLQAFKKYLEARISDEEDTSGLRSSVSGIQYMYGLNLQIYTESSDGKIIHSDQAELMRNLMTGGRVSASQDSRSSSSYSQFSSSAGSSAMSRYSSLFQEMLPGMNGALISDVFEKQYDLVYGSWPNDFDELVIVVDEKNEIQDLSLYALGLIPEEYVSKVFDAVRTGEKLDESKQTWSFEDVCGRDYRVILPFNCWSYDPATGTYTDLRSTDAGIKYLFSNGLKLKVSGIIRPKAGTVNTILTAAVGYTYKLSEYIIGNAYGSEMAVAQQADPETDIFTGLTFKSVGENMSTAEKAAAFRADIRSLSQEEKAARYIQVMSVPDEDYLKSVLDERLGAMSREDLEQQVIDSLTAQMGVDPSAITSYISSMTDEELKTVVYDAMETAVKDQYAQNRAASLSTVSEKDLADSLDAAVGGYSDEECARYYDETAEYSGSSFESNLRKLGCYDLGIPSEIDIYAASFEDKESIEDAIAAYNRTVSDVQEIRYTDIVGIMMSGITVIINAITYVLIAFVAISLVVSSIMIGVITLISVQERTKEIGILRAIGASKANVSSMFNAETVIIGFCSGLLGIIVTYLLCIPVNILLNALTGIVELKARLPVVTAVILIMISMLLTLISGLIPSRSAAKKDPVVALRTE